MDDLILPKRMYEAGAAPYFDILAIPLMDGNIRMMMRLRRTSQLSASGIVRQVMSNMAMGRNRA